jgi:hypothetical protein
MTRTTYTFNVTCDSCGAACTRKVQGWAHRKPTFNTPTGEPTTGTCAPCQAAIDEEHALDQEADDFHKGPFDDAWED